MVSARLVDCSEEPEEPDMQKIPEMMFAARRRTRWGSNSYLSIIQCSTTHL
ncbi:unnamed protein product [Brassica napus]|uniref:(rape) hypothetical protein n=1 Tax=Brassica napus TaxID=3708 RepID=A0A816LYR2_BRANA|nr:unnamed protein product [Brassica napus]